MYRYVSCLTNRAMHDIRLKGFFSGYRKNSHIFTEQNNEINCMDFNQEGDRFATAGRDHCIRVYDTETLKVCDFVFTAK